MVVAVFQIRIVALAGGRTSLEFWDNFRKREGGFSNLAGREWCCRLRFAAQEIYMVTPKAAVWLGKLNEPNIFLTLGSLVWNMF